MAWTGEWNPYAFSPFVQSFGGDIIDRSTYCEAEGVLNGDAGVAFGEWWQRFFERGLSPGTSQDTGARETGFIDGRYALQWMGNWAGVSTLAEVGDDLIILPAPDFGHGNIIGAASWQLGASSSTEHPEGVSQFIEFAIQDEWLTAFSDATGLAPATPNAAAMSENYSAGGPLEVFYELSNDQALIRPVPPGYATLALIFEKALVFSLIIANFIVPFEVIAIALLLVVNNLPWIGPEGFEIGWLNTYHVQIIPFIADSLGIFLFYQYFRDLPNELMEAARIDGASLWQLFTRIVMPISGPIIATVAILQVSFDVERLYLAPDDRAHGGIAPDHGRLAILLPALHALGRDYGIPDLGDDPGVDLLLGAAAGIYREHRRIRRQGLDRCGRFGAAAQPKAPALSRLSLPVRSSRWPNSCTAKPRAQW